MSNDLYSFFLYCYGNSIKTRNDTIFIILFSICHCERDLRAKLEYSVEKLLDASCKTEVRLFSICFIFISSEHHSKTMAHFHVILGLHIANYVGIPCIPFFPPLFLGNNDLWKSSVSSERNQDFLLCNSSISSSFNTLVQQRHVVEFS